MSDPREKIIDLMNVSFGYNNRPVLAGIILSVIQGELVIIEGATGAGKTTLIRAILGAQRFQSGVARIIDTDLTRSSPVELERLRRRIGVVFQIAPFLNQESVLTNVTIPLAIRGDSPKRRRVEGTRALVDAGLAGAARKKPSQLSGGRTSAIANRPRPDSPALSCIM